jgi:hypothetical protein
MKREVASTANGNIFLRNVGELPEYTASHVTWLTPCASSSPREQQLRRAQEAGDVLVSLRCLLALWPGRSSFSSLAKTTNCFSVSGVVCAVRLHGPSHSTCSPNAPPEIFPDWSCTLSLVQT